MKILKLLAVLWTAAIMSVAFTSCSKDDDDDKDDKEESLIIGTWRDSSDEGWDEFTFKKDGSFSWTFYEEGKGPADTEIGTYTYNHPALKLTFEEGDIEMYRVISISSSKLVLRFFDDEEDETWTYTKR